MAFADAPFVERTQGAEHAVHTSRGDALFTAPNHKSLGVLKGRLEKRNLGFGGEVIRPTLQFLLIGQQGVVTEALLRLEVREELGNVIGLCHQ